MSQDQSEQTTVRPRSELTADQRAELVNDSDDPRTEKCECCGIWVPESVEENQYGRTECRRCRREGRGRWPYVEDTQYVLGATIWAYENGRVKVVPTAGETATRVAEMEDA